VKKSFLFLFVIALLLSGCCSVQRIGLNTGECSRKGVDYLEIWLPFGIPHSSMGMDFLYFRREIPFTHNTEINAYNALNELLKGPNDEEKQKGASSLVRNSRILDLKIRKGKAKVNFSKEFAPPGGSLAVWQCRIAVEEVLRQFPAIKKVEIFIEGIPAIESLQP
jgi:hypothetical protein